MLLTKKKEKKKNLNLNKRADRHIDTNKHFPLEKDDK